VFTEIYHLAQIERGRKGCVKQQPCPGTTGRPFSHTVAYTPEIPTGDSRGFGAPRTSMS
jgi:hypothetical protein